MLKKFFDDAVLFIEESIRENDTAQKRFFLESTRFGQRLYSGGQPLVLSGVCAPFEMLSAMGVNACFVEFWGGLLATVGLADAFLEEADHAGFQAETCTWHRIALGTAAKGMMPVPDVMIATSSPCTGGVAAVENLARKYHRPLFVLTIPPDDSERNVRYLVDQLRRVVDFVTAHTGQTLDESRLKNAINKTNEARQITLEAYRLAQRVPSPIKAKDIVNFGITQRLFLGTQEAVDVARAYRDEFAARVDQGLPGVPGERHRLLWLQEPICFQNPLIEMLEANYQASVVVDELNDIYWEAIDPDDPFTGIARRLISFPFNGTVDRRLSHVEKLVEVYQIDGVINPCHWGCRQLTGARGLISRSLQKLGIPVINLEVDCGDRRNFAEGQMRTRLEAFMELLGGIDQRQSRKTGEDTCTV